MRWIPATGSNHNAHKIPGSTSARHAPASSAAIQRQSQQPWCSAQRNTIAHHLQRLGRGCRRVPPQPGQSFGRTAWCVHFSKWLMFLCAITGRTHKKGHNLDSLHTMHFSKGLQTSTAIWAPKSGSLSKPSFNAFSMTSNVLLSLSKSSLIFPSSQFRAFLPQFGVTLSLLHSVETRIDARLFGDSRTS